jgi:L,D-transpeptidase YcbB
MNNFYTKNKPSKVSGNKFFIGLLVKVSSLIILILVTSCNKPISKQAAYTVPYSSVDLQYEIFNAVYTSKVDFSVDGIFNVSEVLDLWVQRFYEQREFSPAWTIDGEVNGSFEVLTSLLDSANYFGFPSNYFNRKSLYGLALEFNDSKSLSSRVSLEIATTSTAFKLMLFLKSGVLADSEPITDLKMIETIPDHLGEVLLDGSLRSSILGLQPQLAHFQRIINSLPNFIDLHLSVKYTTPKFIDDRMLAKALYYAGFSSALISDSSINNSKAIMALKQRYNLSKDSIFDESAQSALVEMLKFRYYQACLNLNRLKRLSDDEDDFLFVNIPEYKLHIVEAKQDKEAFNIIVGKKETPTPVFSSSIEKVVTNPHWTVPRSIFMDMLPKIRKDSTYLDRNGYFVINSREQLVDKSLIDWSSDDPLGYQYCLRQKSSPSNALGQVKIIFPNEYSVYIHDTPSRNLFQEKERHFSYGCIRLQHPDKLAQYITNRFFESNNLNIGSLISSEASQEIYLDKQLKVHIKYITCSGLDDSDLVFFSDIYNLDRKEITSTFPVQDELTPLRRGGKLVSRYLL